MVRVRIPSTPPNNSISASASSCAAYPQSSPFIHSSTLSQLSPLRTGTMPVRVLVRVQVPRLTPLHMTPPNPLKSAHLTISPSTLPTLHNVLEYEYHTRATNPTGLSHSGSLKARIGQLPSLITLIPGELHHWEGKKGKKKKRKENKSRK